MESSGVRSASPVEIERDARRPATILRIADALGERGDHIQDLFKEISSPAGQAIIPIHLFQGEREIFLEVKTDPWDEAAVSQTLHAAAVIRASEHSGAEFTVLSAYPIPGEVLHFSGRNALTSASALFQLDLFRGDPARPVELAEVFRETAGRHWGVNLDYNPGVLPLVEELTLALLSEDEFGRTPPVLDVFVSGLGSYLGEVLRNNISGRSSWRPASDWGESQVLEFSEAVIDPIGKARAFLHEGSEDSVSYYARYVLEELSGGG